MKKTVKSLLCYLIAIIVLSCNENVPSVDIAKLRHIRELNTLEERKKAFSLLNPEEMSALWKYHLNETKNEIELTSGEQSTLNEALAFLEPQNMNSNFTSSREFFEWKQKLDSFNPYSRSVLFFDIIKEKKFRDYYRSPKLEQKASNGRQAVVGGNEPSGCTCNQSDDHCGIRSPGEDACFTYFYSCLYSSCTNSLAGCGWFWLSSCNGGCVVSYMPKPDCPGEGDPYGDRE